MNYSSIFIDPNDREVHAQNIKIFCQNLKDERENKIILKQKNKFFEANFYLIHSEIKKESF